MPRPALLLQELENVLRADVARRFGNRHEEHLQIRRHRQQRVRTSPSRDERQVVIQKWFAERDDDFAMSIHTALNDR